MPEQILTPEFYATVVTIIVTAIILILNHRTSQTERSNTRKNIGDLYEKHREVIERVTRSETTIQIFTETLKNHLATQLHSPHTPEKDVLLEKLHDNTITKEEACKLKEMVLNDIEVCDKNSSERLASSLLLCILESKIPNWK